MTISVLEILPPAQGRRNCRAKILCECGTTKVVRRDQVKALRSCGCLRGKYAREIGVYGRTSDPDYGKRYRAAYYRANKEHLREAGLKWRKANKDNVKRWHQENNLIKHYGLRRVDVISLLTSQGDVCAICKTKRSRFVVDHDHLTSKVRGILCHKCNSGLGMFDDNDSYLNEAIQYLRKAA